MARRRATIPSMRFRETWTRVGEADATGWLGRSPKTLGAAFLFALVGCKTPELTQARVNEELGEEVLYAHFVTAPHNTKMKCVAKPDPPVVDEEEQMAIKAGWAERRCPEDPTLLRVPRDSLKRSIFWTQEPFDVERDGVTEPWIKWRVRLAKYNRSGVPRISAGDSKNERRVVIPGRWNVNEDGRMLQFLKWKPINEIDREVRFKYVGGKWSLQQPKK
jgi:hypothetical protein